MKSNKINLRVFVINGLLLLIFVPLLHHRGHAQVLAFDQLEIRYDQGHYRSVYRKARRLLDKPDYDFSLIPNYYLALAKLQLAQNEGWLKRHKYAIVEAKRTFERLQRTHEGKAVLKTHQYEVSALKKDLRSWLETLKDKGKKDRFDLVQHLINDLFADVPEVTSLPEDKATSVPTEKIELEPQSTTKNSARGQLLSRGEELLGVPYKWAGESPKGFDCSGFTRYLMTTELNQSIDRRAADQYKSAKKIKRKHVQPGDFVFFDNGSGISHVGIVYSTNNGSIQMIHASSSVGISIVDIYQSSYWRSRIAGFGTYFD